MEKTKVLHIITRLDRGGSAENTLLTVAGLDKSRWEISLMSGPAGGPDQDRKAEVRELGIEYVLLPELNRDIRLFRDVRSFFKIFGYLRKKKIDIVHTQIAEAVFLGRLAGRMALFVDIVHTPHGHVFFGYFGFCKTRTFIFMEKLLARISDRLIALTDKEKEDYLRHKIGSRQKMDVIPSGVKLEAFKELSFPERQELKKKLGIPLEFHVVGTAGRLVPVKGPDLLIESARQVLAEHPKTVFLFAGDGELKVELKRRTRELGIEGNVLFLGWRKDIADIISLLDIFVLPSLNEGMGRVLVEAMALGKPIVASRVCGITDLVVHGKNGFLFTSRDTEQMAQFILSLIGDEKQRERMGQEGRGLARNFTASAMVEKIDQLYKELMSEHKLTSPP